MHNKYHTALIYFWILMALAVILVFVFAPGIWTEGSVLFLVLVACYEQARFHALSKTPK